LLVTFLSAAIHTLHREVDVHLLASPLTTSALLPINLNRPMTFFRHVPILPISIPNSREEKNVPSQHITLFSILDDQYQLINTIDLIFDALNQRTKGIGNIIDKGVRNPIGCYRDIIFQLLDSAPDILRMGCASEMELIVSGCMDKEGGRTDKVPSLNTMMYMLRGSR
jgi:hypothetical protein